jgi:membrane peptidoglycan carboxypeptidase
MRVQAVRWKIARRHLNRRRSHRLRWSLASMFVLLLILTSASGAGAMYFVSQLPSASTFHIHYAFQNARIYDSRGDLLYNMADLAKVKGGLRIVEPLQNRRDAQSACRGGVNRIPLLLQNAVIATEDATFYKNPGFDPMSILRAAYQDLEYGHIISGASTITQQVVRNTMLTQTQTLNRKAQEVALAYEISKRYSKRKILWYYLNFVPFGNLAYGAQAAAQVYFHEPVCKLDQAQAALLAGLPQAPSFYDPVRHRAAAFRRMHTVLTSLKRHSYIYGSGAVNAELAEAQHWRFYQAQPSMRYPQFTQYVVNQLNSMPRLRQQLYQGIDVYTTLDPRLQNMAQAAVTRQIDGLQAQHVTNGALVSLDLRQRHYGWILAMVGSAHFSDRTGQINMAISPRQPGSSMKPFNYIYAFTHGNVAPGTQVSDSPIILPDPNDTQHHGWYMPADYDRLFHGPVTLRQALANSLNVPAVKVEYYITSPKNVARTAANFGMTSLYRDNPGLGCSVCYAVTLGGLMRGTRLLEETSAYGVFSTGGWTVPPVAIWKVIQRSTGKVLFCSEDCPRGVKAAPWIVKARHQVLDAAHAAEMTQVLSDDNARCTPQVCEFGLNSALQLSRPAAAKTGTTESFTDNWTVGYTPQIVTGVWAGNSDHSQMQNVIGVTGAAPIWHQYMESAFELLHLPVQNFAIPTNLVTTNQCMMPGSTLPRYTSPDIFIEGPTQPYQLPLCRIAEHGSMPVSCAKYPANPLPLTFKCLTAPPYTYTFGSGQIATGQYPNNGTGNTYPNNGTTFQAPVQPYTPTIPQSTNPVAPPVGSYQAQP